MFGRKGYDATSIREIANAAKANLASIGYHFGGKEGLRRACAEHVSRFMGSVIAAGFAAAAPEGDSNDLSRSEARQRLATILRTLVRTLLLEPRSDPVVRFVLRELADPSFVLDIVYSGVMEPGHRRLCRLWAAATGDEAESERVRLAVFAMIGQLFYFRLGRPIILRRMNWKTYSPDEAGAVEAVILRNLEASLIAHVADMGNDRAELNR